MPPRRTGPQVVSVTVLHNRFPPTFEQEPYKKTIRQDSDLGTEVVTVRTKDRDTQVWYNFHHSHGRTGQHPSKFFVMRPCQGEKNNNELLQCLFFNGRRVGPRWTSPWLSHPKRISGRWILVPFGDAVSSTNVLSFAQINVVSVRILVGQLTLLTPRPVRL